ncbi:MAG: SGNH/GDSL hydrolase family protein [Alphaproteobacteria bacterium]|nr:SGNH/GDSL hydrolase family protein [Alphaproteobacteria bacterium]
MLLALLLACSSGPSSTGDTGASATDAGSGADSGAVDSWDPSLPISERCFAGIGDAAAGFPDYDQFGAVVPYHCQGTDHQDIDGIEKVVFLGDSVTAGTPPTPSDEYYRVLLAERLTERFGPDLEIADCSRWGERTDDLLQNGDTGLSLCFPEGTEPKRTLIIMTIGGNDAFAAAEKMAETGDATQAAAVLVQAVDYLEEAMLWIREGSDPAAADPALSDRFPGGVFVVVGNVYEYTDATGVMDSCPAAEILGFGGTIPELRDGYIYINENWLRIATETGTDAIFMLEHFCGHGFFAGDPDNECFRGEDAETWFDGTCIHPNPIGHEKIADMFWAVITDSEDRLQ